MGLRARSSAGGEILSESLKLKGTRVLARDLKVAEVYPSPRSRSFPLSVESILNGLFVTPALAMCHIGIRFSVHPSVRPSIHLSFHSQFTSTVAFKSI